MHPPPPRSTLFPYTTLFRSAPEQPDDVALADDAGDSAIAIHDHHGTDIVLVEGAYRVTYPGTGGHGIDFADRKSTRLNSSHPSISYAVFCLKKKKKKQDHPTLETINHNKPIISSTLAPASPDSKNGLHVVPQPLLLALAVDRYSTEPRDIAV